MTAPPKGANNEIQAHFRKDHEGKQPEFTDCFYQVWFGEGDKRQRTNKSLVFELWRLVRVPDPAVENATPLSQHALQQYAQFAELLPPPPTAEPKIIDRRELAAVVHRLRFDDLATVEQMRSHVSLTRAQQGTAIEGVDVPQLAIRWVRYLEKLSTSIPDTFLFLVNSPMYVLLCLFTPVAYSFSPCYCV